MDPFLGDRQGLGKVTDHAAYCAAAESNADRIGASVTDLYLRLIASTLLSF